MSERKVWVWVCVLATGVWHRSNETHPDQAVLLCTGRHVPCRVFSTDPDSHEARPELCKECEVME